MKKSLFVLPALLMACGFEPEAGTYDIEMTVVEDSCGFFANDGADTADTGSSDEALTWDLTLAEDGSTVSLDDEMECARDGKSFMCEESSLYWDFTEDVGIDAVVNVAQMIHGTWDSATTMGGDFMVSLSCEGAECDAAAALFEENDSALPCGSNGTFSAVKETSE